MDVRELTPTFSVSPQIALEDLAELAAAGYTTVICNRPDAEIGPDLQIAAMRAAAEAAGLRFVENPVTKGDMSQDNVARQGEVVAEGGRTLAYCASGTRSCVAWAFSQAPTMSADDLIAAGTRGGYSLEGFRPQFDALFGTR